MATVTMELRPQAAQELQPEENVPPSVAASALERWNQPRSNAYRTLATFWAFLVMGANDAVYGVSAVDSLNASISAADQGPGVDSLCKTSSTRGVDRMLIPYS